MERRDIPGWNNNTRRNKESQRSSTVKEKIGTRWINPGATVRATRNTNRRKCSFFLTADTNTILQSQFIFTQITNLTGFAQKTMSRQRQPCTSPIERLLSMVYVLEALHTRAE